MKPYVFKQLRSDSIIFGSLVVGMVAEIIYGVTLLFFFRNLPPQVPLFYSIPWGVKQLVPWWYLGILFLAGFGLLILSLTISLLMQRKEGLLARIVMAGGTLGVILLSATAVKIIFLTHF